MVYEVKVDCRPIPTSFKLIGSLPIANFEAQGPSLFKINGDRVLVHFGARLLVWDLVSQWYYLVKLEMEGHTFVRGISHSAIL